MEESLVGTAGQSLIHDLYHGKMMNTIQCGSCGTISKRDEDFLDLCVSVSGSSRLEDSLARMFLEPEVLDSSNQYRCDACGQLADALKHTRLYHLPPVLTISLLRFNYDSVKMERYKETGRFEFPVHLDLSCYCNDTETGDKSSPSADGSLHVDNSNLGPVVNGLEEVSLTAGSGGDSPATLGKLPQPGHRYELFSVIVHRGGAHGGHYHALIRDMEGRGMWTQPESTVGAAADKPGRGPQSKTVIQNQQSPEVDLACPRSVIASILLANGMSVGDLAAKIAAVTGDPWKKRYKPRHGSLVKFIKDNSDLFAYDSAAGWISLVPESHRPQSVETGLVQQLMQLNGAVSPPPPTSTLAVVPPPPTSTLAVVEKKSLPKVQHPDICSPRSVITSILLESGGAAGLSVTDLCSKISDMTGDSWRKRYKPKHGSLVKFLSENSDVFVHDPNGGWVNILVTPASEEVRPLSTEEPELNGIIRSDGRSTPEPNQSPDIISSTTRTKSRAKRSRKKSKMKSSARESISKEVPPTFHQDQMDDSMKSSTSDLVPESGHCWFDFNDATIRPIQLTDVEKHVAGKECAYMLFYRAVPAADTDTGPTSEHMEIPEWLMSEIAAENLLLEQQHASYEEFANVVMVEIHFGRSYEFCEGILRPMIGTCYYMEHSVDIRQDAGYLVEVVSELGGELVEQCHTIHTAKSLPSGGLHLYYEVTADLASSLKSCGVAQSTKLFVWNGQEIGGQAIPVGHQSEPVTLRFQLETLPEMLSLITAKNTTICALRSLIAGRLGFDCPEMIQLYKSQEKVDKCEPLAGDLDKTISELGLCAKDRIIVHHSGSPTSPRTAPFSAGSSSANVYQNCLPKQITVYCENHVGDDIVMVNVEVDSAASVEELKVLIMTSADVPIEMVADVRLRVREGDLGILGVGPPLYESVDLAAARLCDGVTLVLEIGKAPQDTEMLLTVSVSGSAELELVIDRDMMISQVLHEVLLRSGSAADGQEWHLCRSDWTGDTGPALADPGQTVVDAGINHGDRLFLRPGCPAPPGYLRLFVHPQSSPARPCWWDPVSGFVAAVLPTPVGSVLISKQSTLSDLKEQIITILKDSVLKDYDISSSLLLRLRTLTSSLQPTSILRQHCQTLSKLKLGSDCALGVEVLPVEEDLGPEQMMLVVRRRLPGERSYGDWAQEVIWDTSGGATVVSLRSVVAETIGETDAGIRMAKYIPDKFDWLSIQHSDDAFHHERGTGCGVGGSRKKRKRKAKTGKPGDRSSGCDLKSSPFSLRDGDIIGVKVTDEPGGADSDFGCVEDDAGKERLKTACEETAAVREAVKNSETKAILASTTRRVERPIKIHVDNFR